MENYIAIDENTSRKTTLTFKRATPTSDYVRILQVCNSEEPKTLREIYPGISSPLAGEVQELARLGYLQKYTTVKHIHNTRRYYGFTRVDKWYSKVWYCTTDKGRELVDRILSTTKSKKTEKKTSKTKSNADSAWKNTFTKSMEAFANAMDAFHAAMSSYKVFR